MVKLLFLTLVSVFKVIANKKRKKDALDHLSTWLQKLLPKDSKIELSIPKEVIYGQSALLS